MLAAGVNPFLKRMIKGPIVELCSRRPIPRVICWRVAQRRPRVAITFDDGPHPVYTPQTLDVLAEHDVKATFFVLGEYIENNPEIFQRLVDEGHEVGIHGYVHDHRDMPNQTLRTIDILARYGVTSALFRPPNGILEPTTALWMVQRGFSMVFWSVDGRDSMRHEGKDDIVPDYSVIKSGDILLLHDDNPVCVSDLRGIIPLLCEKQLEPVHLSEFLAAR